MRIINMDGTMLRKAIIAGANELSLNKDLIDSLNVFPVPDGDTGTNMSLTVLSAAKEVESLNTPNVYDVAKSASSGALRGARGNSGVIVSQLFRGFAKALENKSLITCGDLALALSKASELAYKAVMRPKEGTILTISREIAEKAIEVAQESESLDEMIEIVLIHAEERLKATTDMLPELKQADVVDSGGKGLLVMLQGAYESMKSKEDITLNSSETTSKTNITPLNNIPSSIEFTYCTEFFINPTTFDNNLESKVKKHLDTMGDSIVVVSDENIVKIHIHTNHPGLILESALKLGPLSNLKIENMHLQHSNIINFAKTTEENESKDIGFISISAGNGFKEIFKDLGVDIVIEGGQSMNPSIEDIAEATKKINARDIIILPNNKNIILTAELAGNLSGNKNLHVIPTTTLPQGIAAMVNFVPSYDFSANFENMTNAIKEVKTAQITYAVRDTTNNDQEIKKGNILSIIEGEIVGVSESLIESAKDTLKALTKSGGDIISIYYGEDIKEEDAEKFHTYVTETYRDMDIEFRRGNQPLYYYVFSVE